MEYLNQNVLVEVERINELEIALTVFNSKRSLYLDEPNLTIKRFGDSTLLMDLNAPNSLYFNRIKGFGPADIDKIDEILDLYDSAQITPCFDMTPNNINMEVAQALMNKGFICSEQMAFLELEPYNTRCENGEIKIVKVTENHVEEFIRLIALSNEKEIKEELVSKRKKYFLRPDFQNYQAYLGGKAAGMGSLFIKGEKGYMANGFTFPLYRGKGIQKDLLKLRINAAKEMGLKKLYSDVEFGSISHNNMLKLGFKTIFINSFWMKAA